MTQSPAIDVQAFIDQHKLSSFQILVIVLCFLIVAVDGFDTAAAGYADAAAAMNEKYPAPTAEDAVWADTIVFGTPTRFGSVASELKAYIDGLGGVWSQGKLNGKLGSVFGSTSSKHGGNESTLLSLYNVLAHLGLIIVPLGYSHPALFKAGTPYGATFISQGDTQKPSDDDLAAARYQGERIAILARRTAVAPTKAEDAA